MAESARGGGVKSEIRKGALSRRGRQHSEKLCTLISGNVVCQVGYLVLNVRIENFLQQTPKVCLSFIISVDARTLSCKEYLLY